MASRGDINRLLQTDKFKDIVKDLYGKEHLDNQILRYEVLLEEFTKNFAGNIDRLYSSPGRIELCGNHTDHNNGKVLCAAINVDTIAAVQINTKSNIIKIASQGFSLVEVDINQLSFIEEEQGTSKALVKGILRYLLDKGYKIGAFNAATISDVFKGAGVSSSAAFEVLVAEIINDLYNNNTITKMEKAKAAQFAEYAYFGKPCGLMDQSAVALGGVSFIDFEDISYPKVNNMKWIFNNVSVVLVNTGGDHCNLTEHYAEIKTDMEAIAVYFGFKTLRAILDKNFYNRITELKGRFNGRAIMRAMHYFEENNRVDSARDAIMNNDLRTFLKMINESGESSYKKLQNCYVPNDKVQSIPLAISVSKHFEGVKAVRVHGGGFAGTILTFVDKDKAERYAEYMRLLFGKLSTSIVNIRNDGTAKVELI